jgi:hypothetical protein
VVASVAERVFCHHPKSRKLTRACDARFASINVA